MTEFKVGDRIRLTGSFNEIATLDSTGVIRRVYTNGGVEVQLDKEVEVVDSSWRGFGDPAECMVHIGNDTESKATNPKDMIGATKLPLHLFPTTAIAHGALALLDGAAKYGRTNYRAVGVRASIYHDAAIRHIQAWFEGEDVAADSGVSHLGHALACIAILIDAGEAGKLNDDRMIPGGYHEMVKRLTPLVNEIKARHADKSPKHYTIADKE